MLKEVRNVVYLLTIFCAVFFVTKFYLSENNIERSNRIILQHQKELATKFSDLPIIICLNSLASWRTKVIVIDLISIKYRRYDDKKKK